MTDPCPKRRRIDVCSGGWGELVDVLGNKLHVSYVALGGLEKSVRGETNKERLRILHDAMDQLDRVRDRIRLCPRRTCERECESAQFIRRLQGDDYNGI